ncbi:V-type ATPase 116kDa subunit family protein [Mycoplasmatota bacterium WC30]
MAIAKLKLFTITSNLTNLDTVLERFVNLDCVHPVKASEFVDQVHGLTSFTSTNPCNVIFKEIEDLEKENNFTIPGKIISTIDYSLDSMSEYVYTTHEKLQKLTSFRKETQALIKKYQDALTQVKNIENLDISLDDLFSCEYINARVGRIPLDSIEKLKYYVNKPYIFQPFHEEKNYCWCMYLSPNKHEREIDNIFSSLFFERIHIPDFVHGTPESAQVSLAMEIKVAVDSLNETQALIDKILQDNIEELSLIKGELIFLNKIYDAKKYVVGLGDKFNITGFVKIKNVNKIKEIFGGTEGIEIEFMPPDFDKRLKPPSTLSNCWFVKPFASFVEMYGIPGYHDIDPTPIMAITYSLLFGMMFGDLGQGLLLAIIGFLLYRKTKKLLFAIAIRIGLASAFFGFLYGSFFGNEEILTPIFTNVFRFNGKLIHVMEPSFTMTLLISTVALGSVLIITSMILNMISAFRKKKYANLFFSQNGLAGLTFYVFVILAVVSSLLNGVSIIKWYTIIPFIIVPLIAIVMQHPFDRIINGKKMFPKSIGGFFIEAFFELFEVILSYITNTMSFLRVGGFVLAHAGMMMVVYTLMNMSSGIFGQAIILVLGNLFVMGLEGLIVGIQVLRLEFYEMFSRYFEGNGIPFETFE